MRRVAAHEKVIQGRMKDRNGRRNPEQQALGERLLIASLTLRSFLSMISIVDQTLSANGLTTGNKPLA
jgi:hypothetical protein